MNLRCLLLIGTMFLGGAAQLFSAVEAGENLKITVEGLPADDKTKIDALYPVAEDGTVNLPYVGKVRVAGMDHKAIAEAIGKAYVDGKIYRNPKFAVMTGNGEIMDGVVVVYVGGQVPKPGPIAFIEGMTIQDAIKAAGGATPFGSLKKVRLYRKGKMTPQDLTKNENKGMLLEPGDTVDVPQRGITCR